MKTLAPILILLMGIFTLSCSNNKRIYPYPCGPGQYCPQGGQPGGSFTGALTIVDRAAFEDYLESHGQCGRIVKCRRVSEWSRVTIDQNAHSGAHVTIEGFGENGDKWIHIPHSATTSFTARVEHTENGFGWISHGDFGHPYPSTRIVARNNQQTDFSIHVDVDFEGQTMLSGTLRSPTPNYHY